VCTSLMDLAVTDVYLCSIYFQYVRMCRDRSFQGLLCVVSVYVVTARIIDGYMCIDAQVVLQFMYESFLLETCIFLCSAGFYIVRLWCSYNTDG
jgi:hypothetical protein